MEHKNNCANCLHASVKEGDTPCDDCLTEELATKTPYTKWEARQ